MAKSGGEGRSAIDKSLPHDRDAERLILGAILLDNTTINQAAERLRHEDFLLDSHRRIFEKMIRLFERGAVIDPYTLQDELRRAGELEMVGGMAAISNLFEGVPRFSNIDSYTGIVKGKAILRRLITTSNQIMSTCFDAEDEPDAILDQAERLIFSIAEDRIREGFVPIGKVAEQQFKHIGEIAAKGHQLVTGIATGFFNLDSMTSGLQRGDLVVIAARPSMGKTAFGLNIAQNVALQQPRDDGSRPVIGVFSLEMSKEQLAQRLLCSQARIDAHLLRKGILSKEDWRKLAGAVSELGDARIFLDDTPSISVMEMRAKSRRLKNEQHGLDLLIVDYLQLMGSRSRVESRQQEVSQISRELKGLAKELNVPLVALSQLNRAPEARTDKRPQLSDLRESGSIEQDADVVMFIFREDVYKPETDRQNIAEIIIGKQRNGPTGNVELVFLKNLTRFEEKYNES
jgi:replicative DNA helicase